jgi:DNA-binding SARP family transcriptional activator
MPSPSQSLPRLELQCFGAPAALLDGKPAPPELQGRKQLALLIYLALSPGRRRSRAHLVGLLWPDKPEALARHSLSEAMRRLRTHLGVERLVSEADVIVIDQTDLEVDALQFDALVTREPAKAVRLLRGDFLEGFALDDAPAFEEWTAGVRAGYRSRAAAALIAFGEDALAATRYADALESARQALGYQPYAEPAVRLGMRAAALSGDVAASLAAFHEFGARLAQELAEQPSRELRALADRIREQRWRRPALLHTEEEPALVGQERARREAFTLVARALQRGPQTLLISGDPGTGKTRLLTECVERFALEGAVAAVVRPLPSDRDAPWSTLRTLLRGGLLRAPGSAAADPGALGALATLMPEGLPSVASHPPTDHAEVAAGLASLLHALAEEQPVALAVDEAHCADGATIEALGGAMTQLAGLPLLLILSARRTFEDTPRALVRFKSDVGRVGGLPGQAVQLEPLSAAETRELVFRHSAWCVDEADRDRLARRIFFEASGNPFLTVTMLRGLEKASVLREDVRAWPRPGATIEGSLPISVPSLAGRAVMARIAELDKTSLQVLRAASIGALAVDPGLVASLTGLARERVEDLLALLERHRLLTFDGERYLFAAPLIAQVVRGECLAAGERRALRARAVAALATRQDLESRLLRVELMARIGPAAAVFAEAVAAAQVGLAESAPRAVCRALAVAERVLEPGDEQGRRAVDALRVRVPV